MKLLGVLGLDWKIFIIQTLNFLALFAILYWLFFKPFIKALKQEKEKSEELKSLRQQIEKEKKDLLLQKEKEISEMKQRINAIMAEAEKTAKQIKQASQEELSKKEKLAIERIKKQSQAILDSYKDKMIADYKKEALSKLILTFENDLPEETRQKIEQSLWPNFFKKVSQLSLEQTSRDISRKEVLSIFKKIKKEKKSYLEVKKAEIKVFSVFGLLPKQKNNLSAVLAKKLALKQVEIKQEKLKDLIAGFRLEVGGVLVEESLKEKLSKAINH